MLRKYEQVAPMWDSLARYVNNTSETEDVFSPFWELVCRGMDWVHAVDPDDSYESAVAYCHDSQVCSMQELANLYRPHVRNVLAWLVTPEKTPIDKAMQASRFLLDNTIEMRHIFSSNPSFKERPKRPEESALLLRDPQVRLMLTGVCRFLVEQIDRHDMNGEALSDVFPLRLCDRPDCSNLFVFQRASLARFCSDSCRVKVNDSKMTKEARAAKMRKYRAAQKERDAASLKAVMNPANRTSKGGK